MTLATIRQMLLWAFSGPEGASGRVVLSWTLSGGAATGGLVAGALKVFGSGDPAFLVLVGPVFFVLGSFLGVTHGLALAVAGRPSHVRRGEALRRAALGIAVAVLLLPLAWLTSAAIVVGFASTEDAPAGWLVLGIVGWVVATLLIVWGVREGWGQVWRIYTRCRRRNTALFLAVVLSVGGVLILQRLGQAVPPLAGAGEWRLSVPVSLVLTFWVWVPLVRLTLHAEPQCDAPGRGEGSLV